MGVLALLATAVIWGAAFIAQKLGMDHLGPFAFNALRNALAGFALLLLLALRRRADGAAPSSEDAAVARRNTWRGGWWCGIALFAGMALQQIGIGDCSPGVCAFLTTNYVLAVPLIGLFLGRRPGRTTWIGVAAAVAGTYLICVTDGWRGGVGKGELFTLACAIAFGVDVLVVDHWMRKPGVDVLKLCMIQFFVCALLSLPFMALPSERELLGWANVRAGAGAILYCGFISSGIGYTLQNVGQKSVPAPLAAILMSLESTFAALFGWLFMHDVLSPRQLSGCAIVFAAVLFTQLCDVLRK